MLAILLLTLTAGAHSTAAEPGFAVLQSGAGARAAALGDATTALMDAAGAATNPAALPPGTTSTISHTEWIADIRHEHISAGWGTEDGNRYAVGVLLSHSGGLERRLGPSIEPLGDFGVYEWTADAAWSRPLNANLRAGINAKFVRQSIDTDAASGGAVDLGLHYQGKAWMVGVAARNIGRMNELAQQATPLPLQARVGAGYLRGPLWISSDVHWTRDGDAGFHAGSEFRVRHGLVLRGGYQTGDTRNMSLGVGVLAGLWRIDYAYLPFSDGLGQAHRVSLMWHGAGG